MVDAPCICLVYCPQLSCLRELRTAQPSAQLTHTWPDFAHQYAEADVAVVVSAAAEDDVLPERLIALARFHPLPSLIVVTQLDAAHLLPFRRTAVDEFVEFGSASTTLSEAVGRCIVLRAREHLALHVEHLDRMGLALRTTLAQALRNPASMHTIQRSAENLGVTARTLENQWNAFLGPARQTRLEDQFWLIRLLGVIELRGAGTPLDSVCRTFDVEVRSLRRACYRFLGCSLALVSPSGASAAALRLKKQLLTDLR